jgi:CRP/FNR family cyclic AMP-dependent transcriptional regulator
MALFRDLPPSQLVRLRSLLRCTAFPAGATIMTAEQPGEVAYIVLAGTLRVHVDQASGATVILAILGPGEIVGEMSLLDSAGRSATVMTMEEADLLWLDRVALQECVRTMPELAVNLIRVLSRRLRLANEQIQALATLDVNGRVARQLLAFADAYGEPAGSGGVRIPLRLTQTDLADLVGASRVRVNQALVAFKERRHISVDHLYRITVHHPESLGQYCA